MRWMKRSKSYLEFVRQEKGEEPVYKRRTPEMSELKLSEIESARGVDLYNKIRSLGDPYPNAFIRTIDGRRLLLKEVDLE